MSDDEFGLSSSDEADLLNLESAVSTNGKRKNENDEPFSSTKKLRTDLDDIPFSSPAAIATANKVLKQQFGMNSFRLKQEAAINRLLDGGSSVVVFPTGQSSSQALLVDTDTVKVVASRCAIKFRHSASKNWTNWPASVKALLSKALHWLCLLSSHS